MKAKSKPSSPAQPAFKKARSSFIGVVIDSPPKRKQATLGRFFGKKPAEKAAPVAGPSKAKPSPGEEIEAKKVEAKERDEETKAKAPSPSPAPAPVADAEGDTASSPRSATADKEDSRSTAASSNDGIDTALTTPAFEVQRQLGDKAAVASVDAAAEEDAAAMVVDDSDA